MVLAEAIARHAARLCQVKKVEKFSKILFFLLDKK